MPLITDENRKWWTVAAMGGVMFLLTLDFFGLAVALPTIGMDLRASTGDLLWIMNAYLLAFVTPILAMGDLADIVGRRKVLLVGAIVFVAASAACGFAATGAMLIVARIVQGLGGGTIFATSLAMVSNAFSDEERAAGIGMWSAVGTVGSAIGPFVAGVLTQSLSWRFFFFINVPLGIAAIILTLMAVRESRDDAYKGGIDWAGFVTVTLGFVLLTFGLQQSTDASWTSWIVIGSLIVGAIMLAAFAVIESRVRSPMVEFGLFETPRFAGAAVVAFVGNWMFGAIIFFLTLYLQEVLEFTPVQAGLIFLAFTIPLTVMSPVSGRMVARYGAQPLMALGMACIAAGFICFAFISGAAGPALVIAGLVISGFGQGFAFNISNSAGMEAISPDKAGIASGVLSTVRLMGIIIGLALSGVLFRGLEHHALLTAFEHAGATLTSDSRTEILRLLSGSEAAERKLTTLAPALQDRIEGVTDYAFTRGLRGVMILCAVLSAGSVWPAMAGAREAKRVTSAHPLTSGIRGRNGSQKPP